jgi:hypothetical protein
MAYCTIHPLQWVDGGGVNMVGSQPKLVSVVKSDLIISHGVRFCLPNELAYVFLPLNNYSAHATRS